MAEVFSSSSRWLPRRDSNPNKQNQNLRCYHYTTRQSRVLPVLAGSTGLEPATPGSTVQCANQLRHNPVFQKVMHSIAYSGAVAQGGILKNFHFSFFVSLSGSSFLPSTLPSTLLSSGNFRVPSRQNEENVSHVATRVETISENQLISRTEQ